MQNHYEDLKNPMGHTQVPVNIGTSVMGLRFKDGVILAADTAVAYGSMKKTKHTSRMAKLSTDTAIACSGEMSDYQELLRIFREKHDSDVVENDGAHFLKPRDYFNFLSRLNYQRRMKMDPLWNGSIIGGVRQDSGEAFLGMVDLYGTKIESNFLLTGLAVHYCQVLMQNSWRADMTLEEGRKLIEDCMRVMFYRDKKATDEIQLTVITQHGIAIEEPYRIDSRWNLEFFATKTNEFWRPIKIWQ